MYKKILVPTDGSKFSEKSEEHALFLAEAVGAEVIGLSVVDIKFFNDLPAEDTIYEINQILKEESKKNLDRFKDIKREKSSNIKIRTIMIEGFPADTILEVAKKEDVDLIVIGSSGRTGLQKFLMGSVADKVVKTAKCNVLVVH
ncbi:MAG: universal stress protein [Methanobrevibacter sp.]|jgi:nucleotide-binding universal stress UspA family protein|nr:universal stress protein [Candidatus Methanovirga basalitermitum]